MSQNIDPREVLLYLNELGYNNINAQQLKEFIIDLKKLIKYDSRRRTEHIKNVSEVSLPNNERVNSSEGEGIWKTSECATNERDVFETLYNQPTISSKAKEKDIAPPKTKQIAVQITKTRPDVRHTHCVHIEYNNKENINEKPQDSHSGGKEFLKHDSVESTTRSNCPCSKQSLCSKHSSSTKAQTCKSSLTKFSSAKASVNKNDPVALYHHYKSQWKKAKIPGEDNRDDIRWAVRARMLHGPKVELHPTASKRKIFYWR